MSPGSTAAATTRPRQGAPLRRLRDRRLSRNDGRGIGTPDRCREQIERFWAPSNGGFGVYLTLAHNWAPLEATKRSHELVARGVFPLFQGYAALTMAAGLRAQKVRPELAAVHAEAVESARTRYGTEAAGRAG